MDATSFVDRRSTPRIVLRAYGNENTCLLRVPDVISAQLIDVSPNGARLKCQSRAYTPKAGQQVSLDLGFKNFPVETARISAEIRWHDGQEFGVLFHSPLDVTVSELQRALDIA